MCFDKALNRKPLADANQNVDYHAERNPQGDGSDGGKNQRVFVGRGSAAGKD